MNDKNLINFKEEFIVAGPRNSVVNILNIMLSMSCELDDKVKANFLLNSKKRIVLLCINNGINGKYGSIKVLSREWWDMWHNRKNKLTKNVTYKTYNARRQKQEILNLFNTKEIELLIPEE